MATVTLLYSSILSCLILFLTCESRANHFKVAVDFSLSKAICKQVRDFRQNQRLQDALKDQDQYSVAPHPCGWVHWKKCSSASGRSTQMCNTVETKRCGQEENRSKTVVEIIPGPANKGPFIDFPPSGPGVGPGPGNSQGPFIDFPPSSPGVGPGPANSQGPFIDFPPSGPGVGPGPGNDKGPFIDFPPSGSGDGPANSVPIIDFPDGNDGPGNNPGGRPNEVLIDFPSGEPGEPPSSGPGDDKEPFIDFPPESGPGEDIQPGPENNPNQPIGDDETIDFPSDGSPDDGSLCHFPPCSPLPPRPPKPPSQENDQTVIIDFPSDGSPGQQPPPPPPGNNQGSFIDFPPSGPGVGPGPGKGPFIDFPPSGPGNSQGTWPPSRGDHKGGKLHVSKSLAIAICSQRRNGRRSRKLQPALDDKDQYDKGDISCGWLSKRKSCSRSSGDCSFMPKPC